MAHAIVIDGNPQEDCLRSLGYDVSWLEKTIDERGSRIDDIFLMTINDRGKANIILKEKEDK